jgi:aminoglycoside phosphotransferase (APT) family kinase protein
MPDLLASGRTADVFALGPDRVLRRYRDGWSAEREADIMTYVGGLGYPVPAVYEVAGPDMVMERVDGPTMAEAMATGAVTLHDGVQILADLHTLLHALPARVAADPGDRILHLDLHPENVLIAARGPVVIDWANASEGPPDLDIALSALILAEVAVDPAHPLAEFVAAAVPVFLSFTGVPAKPMIERALAIRLANITLSESEKARLASAAALIR